MATRKAARLDRTLCDMQWRHQFPIAHIRHLGHVVSNHCPLLLQLDSSVNHRLGSRPFKF